MQPFNLSLWQLRQGRNLFPYVIHFELVVFIPFDVTFRSILLSQQTKGVNKCLILILIGWHIAQK